CPRPSGLRVRDRDGVAAAGRARWSGSVSGGGTTVTGGAVAAGCGVGLPNCCGAVPGEVPSAGVVLATGAGAGTVDSTLLRWLSAGEDSGDDGSLGANPSPSRASSPGCVASGANVARKVPTSLVVSGSC